MAKKKRNDDYFYRCPKCGNAKYFAEVCDNKEYDLLCFGRQKDRTFLCDSDIPEKLIDIAPDYILCAKCGEQVG